MRHSSLKPINPGNKSTLRLNQDEETCYKKYTDLNNMTVGNEDLKLQMLTELPIKRKEEK